ncbi:YlbE-like family protein [Lentibacillus saliphilus]|uniref:YlbE-like family protein n=1 Tax=Lentibacillus saliphilus TaxID=2737028 RepID=UPI001C2F1DF0|nr:YlbE-like family protein [Lentibacillus saliphilus]
MQPYVYEALQNRPDLLHVVRHRPEWYRILTREPEKLVDLEKAAKEFYGKTMTQRIERFGQRADMVNMLIQMAGIMKGS